MGFNFDLGNQSISVLILWLKKHLCQSSFTEILL